MKKIKNIIYILLLSAYFFAEGQQALKLYACYSPSHSKLAFDWFLPSICDDFEVKLQEFPQDCPQAMHMKPGFTKAVLRKVDFIIDAIKENWGEVIIYSDVDIIFLRSTKDDLLMHLVDNDIAIQTDFPKKEACTGFFICKCNENTLRSWLKTKELMERDSAICDQIAFNRVVKDMKSMKIKCLPREYAHGSMQSGGWYKKGSKVVCPKNAFIYHVNYTSGVDLKIDHFLQIKKYLVNMPS